MTEQTAIALLTIAATLAVAAIGAYGWLIKLTLQLDRQQSAWRHEMRNEIHELLQRTEDNLTRRVERLEALSIGWQRWSSDAPAARRPE